MSIYTPVVGFVLHINDHESGFCGKPDSSTQTQDLGIR